MKTYQLRLFQGHAIIEDDNNIILVDTGAPTTIHHTESLRFNGDQYHYSTTYAGLTIQSISDLLGTQITTLLGADILAKYHIILDYRNNKAMFSHQEIEFAGTEVSISRFMGIPIVEFSIDNFPVKLFLDTGAKLSYLSETITRNYETTGMDRDFYPGVGQFETECFMIPTQLYDVNFNVTFGNLPDILQTTLMVGGTDGIMGFDFFNNFPVYLDLARGTLKYTP